jgi:circadian clock protein KaiC
VFAPRITLQREDRGPGTERCKTGIEKFDALMGEGIPRGSSLLVAGVAGTGKTVLLLEFLYQGAKAGEKGIIFSFEETKERLLATAHGLGWDLEEQIERGMIEMVFIAQPDIFVEKHLHMMHERAAALGAKRMVIDSSSVFLHRIKDPQVVREKIFQLASIVQNTQAVGLFATDIPYGASQISRFGVEETVVDGIILLTSSEEGHQRQRYVEIYKLRNTAHLKGRHHMVIGPGGITVFPRYVEQVEQRDPPPLETARRLNSGVPGLDPLFGGGLLERSVTLLSGSAGIGKSTLGLQFLLAGAQSDQPGLYVAVEEGPRQIARAAEGLGLPLQQAIDKGLIEIMYLSNEYVQPSQFLTLLADKIHAQHTRRLVLDSVSHIARAGSAAEDLRQLLYAMVGRFKSCGVTSMLTLESDSLYSTDTVTECGYSPIADNILMLRYRRTANAIQPTAFVVKTRGSAHDWGTYYYAIGQGGIRIGERVDEHSANESGDNPARKPGER